MHFAIIRCFRTIFTATIHVLSRTLPLDLQVEKENILASVLCLNCDIGIGPVHICADKIQRKVERWKVHPSRAQGIDWEEVLQVVEGPTEHQRVTVLTDVSKITDVIDSSVAIFNNGIPMSELSYGRLPNHATMFQAS